MKQLKNKTPSEIKEWFDVVIKTLAPAKLYNISMSESRTRSIPQWHKNLETKVDVLTAKVDNLATMLENFINSQLETNKKQEKFNNEQREWNKKQEEFHSEIKKDIKEMKDTPTMKAEFKKK